MCIDQGGDDFGQIVLILVGYMTIPICLTINKKTGEAAILLMVIIFQNGHGTKNDFWKTESFK